jgi:hypothetical protein
MIERTHVVAETVATAMSALVMFPFERSLGGIPHFPGLAGLFLLEEQPQRSVTMAGMVSGKAAVSSRGQVRICLEEKEMQRRACVRMVLRAVHCSCRRGGIRLLSDWHRCFPAPADWTGRWRTWRSMALVLRRLVDAGRICVSVHAVQGAGARRAPPYAYAPVQRDGRCNRVGRASPRRRPARGRDRQ